MNGLTENKKFITTTELKDMGYSYYKIGKLEKNGLLRRVNRSTYENLSYKGDENDFFSAEAFVPNGVICLMSAARYYELTNFLPDTVDVAIERKKKVATLPDWPEIKIFYFDPVRMDLGVPKFGKEIMFFISSISKKLSWTSSTTGIRSVLRKHLRCLRII